MTISADILSFAGGRPLWEQDLLRRIYTQADLTSDDLDAVLALLKKSKGFEGFDGASNPIPLAVGHVLHQPDGLLPVVLASVGEAEHAMQLAKNQAIPFAVEGLTVIYGENGSGKSGYCKLLKQICRARRERDEDIVLANVYDEAPGGVPTVNVRFRVGADEPTETTWQAGNPGPDELSRISVFDSRLAPLYADKEDKIEFLPLGLDVLPRLVKACDDLGHRIAAETQPLKLAVASPLPVMPQGTPQAAATANLTDKIPLAKLPTVETLQNLGSWTPDDVQELQQVKDDLASDPAVRARNARQGAAMLRTRVDNLEAIYATLSDGSMNALDAEITACCSARDAAQVAASEQFKADPLGGVIGGEPWRQMFVYAAQVYTDAFPDKEFPSHGDARICPLCEQGLDDPAFDRIQRFQAFIGDAASKDAEAKAQRLTELVTQFAAVDVPKAAATRTALAPYALAGSAEAQLLDDMTAWIEAAATRKQAAITAARSASPLPSLPALQHGVIDLLTEWHGRLETSATEAEAAAQDADRIQKLKAAETGLLARQAFHGNLDAILLRRDQLVQLKQLSDCLPPRYTQPISVKNTDLCQKYLTEDFGKKLCVEMKELGIDYLPVVVRGRTDRGVNYVGPDLTKSVPARTSNVLSEGEFRALSLACFFAEIDVIDGHNGIILDDPVSSLDHNHVQQVAARVIREAAKRQVIVFTHELSFYYELWHQAAEAQTQTARHWIRKSEEHGFGVIEADAAPWQAKSTRERLNVLDDKLISLRKRNDQGTEAYERAVTDFYTSLRETWERLVEEKLLNSVVGRFQPGVQTQSLSGVEVGDQDHRTVYFAMKRASEFSGHDWAKGRLPKVSQIAEMETAISEARTYLNTLNKRTEETSSKRRKAVESPPVGITV